MTKKNPPNDEQKSDSQQAAQRPKQQKAMDSLLDDVGVSKAGAAGSCPNCKQQMPQNAVLCINCGFHLEDGRQLGTKSLIRKHQGVGKALLGTEIRADLPSSLIKLMSTAKLAGIVCVLFASCSISVAVIMATMPEVAAEIQSRVHSASVALFGASGVLSFVSGVLSFFVSNKARRGSPTARTLGWLTSCLMLPLVPFGTLFGLMMIILLIHPETKRFYR
jgi:hypothetical protein